MGAAVSSSHVVSAAPSSSAGGLLTLCPCSSVKIPLGGGSSSGTGCSSVGPPRGHKPFQQTCFSSVHGSAGPGRGLLQCGLVTGSQLPSGIHLLRHGVPSMGYGWISAPLWTSMVCRGTTCLTMVFIMSCNKSLCSDISSTSSPLLLH